MEPPEARVSKLTEVVVNWPAVSVKDDAVVVWLNRTPDELLIVRLLTVVGMLVPVTCAKPPLKMQFAPVLKVIVPDELKLPLTPLAWAVENVALELKENVRVV